VWALIYRAALPLDAERFIDRLALRAPDVTYRIQTYRPEIRKADDVAAGRLKGLRSMIEMLPPHNPDHGQLSQQRLRRRARGGRRRGAAIGSLLCHPHDAGRHQRPSRFRRDAAFSRRHVSRPLPLLWQRDMKTGEGAGLAQRKLLRYPTRRDGTDVWIELERELNDDPLLSAMALNCR
jgi:hypothetical protein